MRKLLSTLFADKKQLVRGISFISLLFFFILSAIFASIGFGFFYSEDCYFTNSTMAILFYSSFILALISCGFIAFSFRKKDFITHKMPISYLRGIGFALSAVCLYVVKLVPLKEDMKDCIKNGLSVAETKRSFTAFVALIILFALAGTCDILHAILSKKGVKQGVLSGLKILPLLVYPITFMVLYRNLDIPVNAPHRVILSVGLMVLMMDAFYSEWRVYKKASGLFLFFRLAVLVFNYGMALEFLSFNNTNSADPFVIVAVLVVFAGLYGLLDLGILIINSLKQMIKKLTPETEEKQDEC